MTSNLPSLFRRKSSSSLSLSSRGSDRGRSRNMTKQQTTAVQGTQATAQRHLESNQKYFKYPKEGFVSPIEHSLIYTMVNEPSIYPPDAIQKVIDEQDFAEFLHVNDETANNSSKTTTTFTNNEQRCSYAQLSALLSLAMQKWPPPVDDSDPAVQGERNVPQNLCQALLRTVVQYADAHELDRPAEVAEFLDPAVERTRQRLGRAIHMKFVLPYFAGAALSIATGNPLPLYLAYTGGMVSYLKDDAVTKEKEHALRVHKQSQRAANVETASLMDEMEQD